MVGCRSLDSSGVLSHHPVKVSILPISTAGKWSTWLIAAFIVLFIVFLLFVTAGQRGGETFFSNLLLAVPALTAGISAIASLVAGIIGVARDRERSMLVYAAMVVGLCVLIFTIGEIAFPH